LFRELPLKSGLFLRSETSFLAAYSGLQFDMTVIQRVDHPAKNVEELFVSSFFRRFGPEGVVLLFPIDLPQFEKRISSVEGVPQDFEILFRVAVGHNFILAQQQR
jgi:hypothetical protein